MSDLITVDNKSSFNFHHPIYLLLAASLVEHNLTHTNYTTFVTGFVMWVIVLFQCIGVLLIAWHLIDRRALAKDHGLVDFIHVMIVCIAAWYCDFMEQAMIIGSLTLILQFVRLFIPDYVEKSAKVTSLKPKKKRARWDKRRR